MEETRGWKTRVKTPGGQLSFEELSAALRNERKEVKSGVGSKTSDGAEEAMAAPRNNDGGEAAKATRRSLAHVRQRGGGGRDVPKVREGSLIGGSFDCRVRLPSVGK